MSTSMLSRMVGALPALVALGCGMPELYTDNYGQQKTFDCPDNDHWYRGEPGQDLLDGVDADGNPLNLGFDEGQTLAMGTYFLNDQHAGTVCPYQFVERPLVIDVSTIWCAPCQKLAAKVQYEADLFADYDLTYATVLGENEAGEPPTTHELDEVWAERFGITEPVLGDTKVATNAFYQQAVPNLTFPVVLIVQPDMTIHTRIDGPDPNSTQVEDAIQQMLDDVGL